MAARVAQAVVEARAALAEEVTVAAAKAREAWALVAAARLGTCQTVDGKRLRVAGCT